MTLTRRGALGLLAMAGLASCAGGASAPKQTTKTVWLVVPDAGFDVVQTHITRARLLEVVVAERR